MDWTTETIWQELEKIQLPVTTFYDEESLPSHTIVLETGQRILPTRTRVGQTEEIVDKASVGEDGKPLKLLATTKWDGALDVELAREERQRAKKEKRTWISESERRATEFDWTERERRLAKPRKGEQVH